ncbi:hypothetical protein NEOLEDRAFT_1142387 [Neolentinus lepideus HHB14362 ss-1]|uniref:Uncharacterized protein n=1 Tax=Neolentinus lepideus HHB14362 ss-1 TaxID=1314782 RepID=A0A165N5L7_9AGAM|nr:hypothetical protein NEOLEDRAFT_1142387 [Neolentinus lepideus HHB14362 ss-1]
MFQRPLFRYNISDVVVYTTVMDVVPPKRSQTITAPTYPALQTIGPLTDHEQFEVSTSSMRTVDHQPALSAPADKTGSVRCGRARCGGQTQSRAYRTSSGKSDEPLLWDGS